jgi:hypothetical protein
MAGGGATVYGALRDPTRHRRKPLTGNFATTDTSNTP